MRQKSHEQRHRRRIIDFVKTLNATGVIQHFFLRTCDKNATSGHSKDACPRGSKTEILEAVKKHCISFYKSISIGAILGPGKAGADLGRFGTPPGRVPRDGPIRPADPTTRSTDDDQDDQDDQDDDRRC